MNIVVCPAVVLQLLKSSPYILDLRYFTTVVQYKIASKEQQPIYREQLHSKRSLDTCIRQANVKVQGMLGGGLTFL